MWVSVGKTCLYYTASKSSSRADKMRSNSPFKIISIGLRRFMYGLFSEQDLAYISLFDLALPSLPEFGGLARLP